MAGEDRQQFARDSEKRRKEYAELAEQSTDKQRQKYFNLAKAEELKRDRYDDAGEFIPR